MDSFATRVETLEEQDLNLFVELDVVEGQFEALFFAHGLVLRSCMPGVRGVFEGLNRAGSRSEYPKSPWSVCLSLPST